MPSIDHELEEQHYHGLVQSRHLTDEVLRQPLTDLIVPEPVCVAPKTSIQKTVQTMREARTGVVLVTSPVDGRLTGIFTERDLLLRVAGRGLDFSRHRVSEVMTPDPQCLSPHERVGFALHMMLTHGYRHLPVLDEDGRPEGIVSQRFLLNYLCEFFPEDVLNQPPQSVFSAPPLRQHGG